MIVGVQPRCRGAQPNPWVTVRGRGGMAKTVGVQSGIEGVRPGPCGRSHDRGGRS